MVKVLTYNIPDYKIKLKIRQLEVMGKKIQGKLITKTELISQFLVVQISSTEFQSMCFTMKI